MRIPNDGEVWYNTQTQYVYVMRNNLFRQFDTSTFKLIPTDSVYMKNCCLLTEKVLPYTIDTETWVQLIEVSPDEYRWLPDISKAASPNTGELWYYTGTGGYYVVDENGIFVLVYLFICSQVSLKRGINAEKYIRDDNAKDGFAGWRFVSTNWKEYLMELFEKSLDAPEKVLFGETVQIK